MSNKLTNQWVIDAHRGIAINSATAELIKNPLSRNTTEYQQ